MPTTTHTFEEIPLCIGKGKYIALISGEVDVSFSRGSDHFDIETITLSAPLLGQQDVSIQWARDGADRLLWDWVADSIFAECANDIWQSIYNAQQPDPDARYDAWRDSRAAE